MSRKRGKKMQQKTQEEKMGQVSQEVQNVAECSVEDAATCAFDLCSQAARVFACAAVGTAIVAIDLLGLIPALGVTLLDMAGITDASSIASVLSIWLVPELFGAALLFYATVAFIRWMWARLGVICETLGLRYREKRARKLERAAEERERKAAARAAEKSHLKATGEVAGDASGDGIDENKDKSNKGGKDA